MTTNTARHDDQVELVDIDAEVGIIVQSMMFRRRFKQADLAAMLGTSQANVSRKLRGLTAFSLTDLVKLSRGLGVQPGDLLPELDSNQQPSGYPSTQVSALASVWSRLPDEVFDAWVDQELAFDTQPNANDIRAFWLALHDRAPRLILATSDTSSEVE